MIRTGRLQERITLERPVRQQNDIGESAVAAWEQVGGVRFAEVIQEKPSEILANRRDAAQALVLFRVRLPCPADNTMRVIWNGQAYGVQGVRTMARIGEATIEARFLSAASGQ